jgi:hypothetical protein
MAETFINKGFKRINNLIKFLYFSIIDFNIFLLRNLTIVVFKLY